MFFLKKSNIYDISEATATLREKKKHFPAF